jgi:hypothetical protein
MKAIKIFLIITVALFGGIILSSQSVFAAECDCCTPVSTSVISNCEENGESKYCEKSNGQGIYQILAMVVTILTYGVGTLGVVGLVITGIQYMTSSGDVSRQTKAKKRIIEIVIGLVAYALAWSLLNWLLPGGLFNDDTGEFVDVCEEDLSMDTLPTPGDGSQQQTVTPPGGGSSTVVPADDYDPGVTTPDTTSPGSSTTTPGKYSSGNVTCGGSAKKYTASNGRVYCVYKQADKAWANLPANGSNPGTMKTRGCMATATATALTGMGIQVDPGDLSYKSGGFNMTGSVKKWSNGKVVAKSGNPEQQRIVDTIKNGGAVVIRSKNPTFTSSQHYMALVDVRVHNGKTQVYIANSTNRNTGWFDISTVLKNCPGAYYITEK